MAYSNKIIHPNHSTPKEVWATMFNLFDHHHGLDFRMDVMVQRMLYNQSKPPKCPHNPDEFLGRQDARQAFKKLKLAGLWNDGYILYRNHFIIIEIVQDSYYDQNFAFKATCDVILQEETDEELERGKTYFSKQYIEAMDAINELKKRIDQLLD
jgi:hypothetical protein